MKKSQMARDVLVNQSERVREIDLAQTSIVTVDEHSIARRRSLTAAVHRQHGRCIERRSEKSAGLVCKMVLDEMPAERTVVTHACKALTQMVRGAAGELAWRVDDVTGEQRVPWRDLVHRRPTCRWLQRQCDGVVAASDAGKQIRIERIGDVVDVAKRCIGLAQAIVDRVIRKLPDRERNRPL